MKGPTKIVLGIGILLVAAALAGIIFEHVGRGRDRIRYPQVGQSFRLGDRTFNMYCSGDGTPTVVFDSSAHTAGYVRLGLQRLFSNGRGQPPITTTSLSPDQQTELIFLSNTPAAQLGGEGCTLDQSLAEVHAAGTLGSRPLVVITSTNAGSASGAPGQPDLAALSSVGRQVVVKSRDAMSNEITQAIRDVVNSVRQDSER
jgi:hypothetical protein